MSVVTLTVALTICLADQGGDLRTAKSHTERLQEIDQYEVDYVVARAFRPRLIDVPAEAFAALAQEVSGNTDDADQFVIEMLESLYLEEPGVRRGVIESSLVRDGDRLDLRTQVRHWGDDRAVLVQKRVIRDDRFVTVANATNDEISIGLNSLPASVETLESMIVTSLGALESGEAVSEPAQAGTLYRSPTSEILVSEKSGLPIYSISRTGERVRVQFQSDFPTELSARSGPGLPRYFAEARYDDKGLRFVEFGAVRRARYQAELPAVIPVPAFSESTTVFYHRGDSGGQSTAVGQHFEDVTRIGESLAAGEDFVGRDGRRGYLLWSGCIAALLCLVATSFVVWRRK